MENKFHERLFEALDFNEEYVSERIFVVEDKLQGERIIHDLSRSVGNELHIRVATPLEICSWICLEEPKYQERILIHVGRAIELITEILEERSSSYNKYASEDIYQLAMRYYHQFALCEFTYKFDEGLSEEEWKECSYIHELYREKKIKQGLYDKPEMISEAQSVLKWMEKWNKQHFVFLDNFRCFGMEMKLIDCIPRECVTVVLQPDDKELTHLDVTNTYIKRATSMMNEVAEIFDSIARNHRDPEECAIIYTDEAYVFLLAYMATMKQQIPLNHIGVSYDVLDLVKHLKHAKRSLDRDIFRNGR